MAPATSTPSIAKQTAAAVAAADLEVSSLRLSSSEQSPQVAPWQVLLRPLPRLKQTRGAASEEVGDCLKGWEEEGPSLTNSKPINQIKV